MLFQNEDGKAGISQPESFPLKIVNFQSQQIC